MSQPMMLFGRGDSVGSLVSSRARLTLVTGDSGVGKTTVLHTAREVSSNEKVIAPPSVAVRRAPGALQRALLESLALAVSDITSDIGAAERLGTAVKRAVEHVANDNLKGLASAVGRQLLGIVRAHVGDAAADVLGRIAAELATPDDAALLARITNAPDSDVVDLVGVLAGETLRVAGVSSLVLTLDNADNLAPEDLRRLADLATHLPEGVLLRAGFATWSGTLRDAASELREAGAMEVAVSGLDVGEVARYLSASGLPEEFAAVVHRVTNGYPLYLEDAIALLKANGANAAELSGLQPRDVLVQRTVRSWHTLDAPTQTAAFLLAGFQEPLSAEAIPDYLGMSRAAWSTLEARLRDAGIFTGQDRLWFHELRRRCIWNDILTVTQRAEAADRALPYVAAELQAGRLVAERLVEYARLAPHSPGISAEPKIAALLAASPNEIAVAAALLELVEPTSNMHGANAEHCLLLAREDFGATGDLRPALTALADRQLVVTASNDRVVVVVPFWGGMESVLVLAGRAAVELGRAPIPSAATQLFEAALRPRLGPFRRAGYGIGTPGVAELSAMAERLQQEQADGTFLIGPRGPNLLVRARHGGLPVYGSFAFEDVAARDAAYRQLSGYDESVFGRPLRCTIVRRHPLSVVPSLRFVLAVERIMGRRLTPFPPGGGQQGLPTPIRLEEEALWRVEFIAAVRALCSEDERLAYELDEAFGLRFHEARDSTFLVEVLGGEGARALRSLPQFDSPFARFQMGNDEGLDLTERIGMMTWRTGQRSTEDPVLDELAKLVRRAREFNRTQERVPLALTAASLTTALTRAAERQRTDALALCAVVSHGRDVPPLTGVSTCVLLKLDDPSPRLVAGAEATTVTVAAPNEFDRDEVVVREVEELPAWGDRDERMAFFQTLFGEGVDASQITGWRHSVAQSELARLSGHDLSEVVFSYSEGDVVG